MKIPVMEAVDMTGMMVVYNSYVCSVSSPLPNSSPLFFLHSNPLHCKPMHHILHHTAGKEVIHYTVVEWLQGSFGCYVTRYGIRRSDLLWMAGVWSGRSCSDPTHSRKEGTGSLDDFMCYRSVIPAMLLNSFLPDINALLQRICIIEKFCIISVQELNIIFILTHFYKWFKILSFRPSSGIYLSN